MLIYHNKEELIATSKSAKENELVSITNQKQELIGFCNATKTDELCALYDKGLTLQYGIYLFRKED